MRTRRSACKCTNGTKQRPWPRKRRRCSCSNSRTSTISRSSNFLPSGATPKTLGCRAVCLVNLWYVGLYI
ncbi:hypothetical protein B5M09_005873 [Aphanomyces astaci]|uniref:Uncharacterized protein n=1 Tax=Aphanomyces astaci TaxID=112090 RepID=A0A425CZ88_APHAT|nr:hypothetical protein B5M09_005873 [Aphanomyces astaci]